MGHGMVWVDIQVRPLLLSVAEMSGDTDPSLTSYSGLERILSLKTLSSYRMPISLRLNTTTPLRLLDLT